jgi:hypothetical protein
MNTTFDPIVIAVVSTGDPLTDWLVNNFTGAAMAAFVIVSLLRGWLVSGREHDRVIVERDRALELVYTQAEATARALDVAERK